MSSSSGVSTVLHALVAARDLGVPGVGRTSLVKLAYLARVLAPVYSLWNEGLSFVRYHYGPYSPDVISSASFLVFHGLAEVQEYSRGNRRVKAFYAATEAGRELAVKQTQSRSGGSLYALAHDLIWSLQGRGIRSAKELCEVVYREPEFAAALEGSPSEPSSIQAAEELLSGLDPEHESFRVHATLEALMIRRRGEEVPPRDLVRLYVLALSHQ